MADLLVLPGPPKGCRMAQASAEKFEHNGPAEKERVASVQPREQLARTPEPPLPKGKGTEQPVQRYVFAVFILLHRATRVHIACFTACYTVSFILMCNLHRFSLLNVPLIHKNPGSASKLIKQLLLLVLF